MRGALISLRGPWIIRYHMRITVGQGQAARNMATVRPLAEVLRYRHIEVIRRFREQFPVSEREAHSIFRETKKWLWLCATSPTPGRLAVTDQILVIDEMWHTFLMYTQDYHAFCLRAFGKFLHHVPTTEAEKARQRRRMQTYPERVAHEVETETRWQCGLIAERLGEATLRKWYLDYPKRYSPARLRRLRLKALSQAQ